MLRRYTAAKRREQPGDGEGKLSQEDADGGREGKLEQPTSTEGGPPPHNQTQPQLRQQQQQQQQQIKQETHQEQKKVDVHESQYTRRDVVQVVCATDMPPSPVFCFTTTYQQWRECVQSSALYQQPLFFRVYQLYESQYKTVCAQYGLIPEPKIVSQHVRGFRPRPARAHTLHIHMRISFPPPSPCTVTFGPPLPAQKIHVQSGAPMFRLDLGNFNLSSDHVLAAVQVCHAPRCCCIWT